ncbi:cell division cycle protein 20 homolog, putative [Plasmodium vivax]|nr:cell division cycle protein 20 homolog, putative [Plasmodium vivax]
MGDSSDRGSASDSQWSDSLTGDSLTGATLAAGYPSTWRSARIKKGEARETPLPPRTAPPSRTVHPSRLLHSLEGKFSTSRKNAEGRIFKYVWMDEDELKGESTEEGEEEGEYKYVYQTRFSRHGLFGSNVDEYSVRRTVLPVREGRGGNKRRMGDNAKNGMKQNGRKITREVNPQWGGVAEEERSSILLENAWRGFKLEEGAPFGGTPFGVPPFGVPPFGVPSFDGGPFGSRLFGGRLSGDRLSGGDPFLCYPLQLCSGDVKQRRSGAKEAYKVLSAPNLVDDFYLNLVDWSRQNVIAVGLRDKLCVWNEGTSRGEEVFTLKRKKKKKKRKKKKNQNDKKKKKNITSLRWNLFGNHLAVGLSNGAVQIWDLEKEVKIRKYRNHKRRVGALDWHYNTLSTGSRDNKIVSLDIRCRESSYAQLSNHSSEVCGLLWNYKTKQLASGSNDNSVCIWEERKWAPLFQFTKHTAAVKAMSWSPHQHNLLATGGGSADKHIFFWDTSTGECLNELATSSQVSNLFWSKHSEELVSTHSYSLGQVVLWKYPRLQKVSTLSGHALRVLYGALSPDGESLVTGSPDETLRLWRVFPRGSGLGSGLRGGLGSGLQNCPRSCPQNCLDNRRSPNHPPHERPFSNCYEQVR